MLSCIPTILLLYAYNPAPLYLLFYFCIPTILLLYTYYLAPLYLLFYFCIPSILLLLFCSCIHTFLLLHIPTILLLYTYSPAPGLSLNPLSFQPSPRCIPAADGLPTPSAECKDGFGVSNNNIKELLNVIDQWSTGVHMLS